MISFLGTCMHVQLEGTICCLLQGMLPCDLKLIVLKLTRLEQQQLHMTQLIQRLMESTQFRDERYELPNDVNLPIKSVVELQELERQLDDEECYKKLVRRPTCSVLVNFTGLSR